MRSPFAPVLVALLALAGALVRWGIQGSGNLYTAISKRFYVADPDLGWRVAPEHPVWLGLEVCAIILAITIGLVIGGFIIRRRENKTHKTSTILRAASWVAAVVPLVVPIAAFVSGGAPANAREQLPAEQAVALEDGVDASLSAKAGRYDVLAHSGNVITAKLTAGGEAFEARFAGDLQGSLTLDPKALASSVKGAISVATASVDTGIGERSKHARESYLLAEKYPRLTFTLGSLAAARQVSPDVVAFRAKGTVGLIGKTHDVEVTGTLTRADAAALTRLGTTGDVLIVKASFTLSIKQTALAPDAKDFDGDALPISVSLVMRHSSEATALKTEALEDVQ